MIDHHILGDLHSIVFGEGLVNDSTALTLFSSLMHLGEHEFKVFEVKDAFSIFGNTLLSFLIAALIGMVIGILGSLGLKHFRFFRTAPLYELMYIFFVAYIAYTITETMHFAGVISLLIVGIFLGSYGW